MQQLDLWEGEVGAALAGSHEAPPSDIEPAVPTEVYDTYWRFTFERQNIFFRRVARDSPPYTTDPILSTHKFTNAYRASDRVSQYLIRNVIYGGAGGHSLRDTFFRILLFKTFNRIDTWELLERRLGPIRYESYSFEKYGEVLESAMTSGQAIYSAAYIMSSGKRAFGHSRKFANHLKLLESMMADGLPEQVAEAARMQDVFNLLKTYPTIGDFLAYQYATDLNYSQITDFDETSFVVPGPGARDGIKKCFSDLGGLDEPQVIKLMWERQDEEFARLGLEFKSLWGRPLKLIDCQNLFCEVAKYARVAHPNAIGHSGRTRIKQKYIPNGDPIDYWYPPKWGLNDLIPS